MPPRRPSPPSFHRFSRLRLLLLAFAFALGNARTHAIEPDPTPQNSFHIFAIWDHIMGAREDEIRAEMDRLIVQFGPGNHYHRIGFAFIQPGPEQLRLICRLAHEKGLEAGVILGGGTHSNGAFRHEFSTDLRCFQWRQDGKSWQGYFTGENNANHLEIKEDSRDHLVPSPSRYCRPVFNYFLSRDTEKARQLHAVMTEIPGVVTVINGVIEEELAVGAAALNGPQSDGLLADYSPFAVTEFRDWLRHTGHYDADGGWFAGQGAPEAIVGPFFEIKRHLRSPFYDDPDPGNANRTGKSFNETFGTAFTTWQLEYWDLDAWPEPITDPAFNPAPESGRGSVAGGFDAPRHRDASAWWTTWSWDYDDRGKQFPPGNPAAPAYGFRQVMIANFVRDKFKLFAEQGLPRELMFPHQIPGEAVGDKRCRSSASPIWSGYLPLSGNVGITRFGPIDPALLTQYSRLDPHSSGWGIFEWHPRPNSKPEDQQLYDTALHDLQTYYAAGCHALFAGWWRNEKTDRNIFPLDDSAFARAIHDFLASRKDAPVENRTPKPARAR
jgi:hypothetical protein